MSMEEAKMKTAVQVAEAEEIARDAIHFLGPPTSTEQITEITLELKVTIDKLKSWVSNLENKRGAWGSIIYASPEADEIEDIQNQFDDLVVKMNEISKQVID